MRVVIRTDASARIGSGHVMRCLALAEGLRRHGAEVAFVTREHDGNLVGLIEARGFACYRLSMAGAPEGAKVTMATDHAEWLGCSQEDDAYDTEATLRAIGRIDWLIVDHYALDYRWEGRMRERVSQIMVIDDLADRRHDCDVLLDQNLYVGFETRYLSLVPTGCAMLLGTSYTLLAPDFAQHRSLAKARQMAVPPYRLLVFFGGADATDETGKFLRACDVVRRSDMVADVVIGASNRRVGELTEFASTLSGISTHRNISNMAEMMVRADYAFGASGVTNWERFCTGLNGAITSVAHNQLALARDLSTLGLVDYLGSWAQTSVNTYARALSSLNPVAEALLHRRTRIMAYVDGLGVPRVVRQLTDIGVN